MCLQACADVFCGSPLGNFEVQDLACGIAFSDVSISGFEAIGACTIDFVINYKSNGEMESTSGDRRYSKVPVGFSSGFCATGNGSHYTRLS